MKGLYAILFLLLSMLPVTAQVHDGHHWVDTLDASVTTDRRGVIQRPGEMVAGMKEVRGVVAPLGEGDPIKWAQSLPGISTGADGGSAIYVRGSNAGANLSTIDGVPIYGFSHILGLTTVLPSDLIGTVSLVKSGFNGNETNFTASHLKIETRSDVPDKLLTNFKINNFLAGVGMEGRINDRMYFIVSGRISPLSLEYSAFKNYFSEKALKDFKANVGDIYAKVGYRINEGNDLTASFLFSNDAYAFSLRGAKERMGWKNMAGSVHYSRKASPVGIDVLLAHTDYLTFQNKDADVFLKGLGLHSRLGETSLSADLYYNEIKNLSLEWGAKTRLARFRSGVQDDAGATPAVLGSVYVQAGYRLLKFAEMAGVLRGSYYYDCLTSFDSFDPEFSVRMKFDVIPSLSLELSHDHMVQYYHTLEGLPVGWSLDMIVPARDSMLPEKSDQSTLTFMYRKNRHSASAGGFYKQMDNLVYNKYAQNLFSDVKADWNSGMDIGKGRSYGAEFLYEYSGQDFYSRLSYTWSKSDRYGFASINEGRPFHAKFDREHVLNAMFQWKGATLNFIYQSGNWENAAAQEYKVHTLEGETTAQYFKGLNDFHMPDVIRLDLGYQFSFETGKVSHDVSIGVCNVTNHFNPFMLYYDTETEGWKMISLLPILPNFSYRISF